MSQFGVRMNGWSHRPRPACSAHITSQMPMGVDLSPSCRRSLRKVSVQLCVGDDVGAGEGAVDGIGVGAVVGTTVPPLMMSASSAVVGHIVGSPLGHFAVDDKTGDITVALGTSLEFNFQPSHSFVISVTDSVGNRALVNVKVRITDVNQAPFFPSIFFLV